MTNEEIKNKLTKLYDCKEDFTVTMSGKASSRVNGLYKPLTHEIILHNKNFKNDNQLMYTAVHEFTHHVLTTEKGVKTTKAHSGAFWATFYDFLDKAIKEGFYTRNRNSKTQELITQAKDIQKALVELQKQLGTVLNKLHEVCEEEGERVEDVIESDLQMSRNKAKKELSMEEFKAEMSGIYSTTVTKETLDEAPMAYKTMDDIVANIGPTADILNVIKPIYNFKAAE